MHAANDTAAIPRRPTSMPDDRAGAHGECAPTCVAGSRLIWWRPGYVWPSVRRAIYLATDGWQNMAKDP